MRHLIAIRSRCDRDWVSSRSHRFLRVFPPLASRLHLVCISFASKEFCNPTVFYRCFRRLHLVCISFASRLHPRILISDRFFTGVSAACISLASRLHLVCISDASRLNSARLAWNLFFKIGEGGAEIKLIKEAVNLRGFIQRQSKKL